jgi:formylglycine-generating enzyme required for sulfatase activity/predicted DNA-binding WGR domain protein
MRRFEFKDAKSNKFWEVEVKGKNLQVTFGKIGTEGQSKPKAFATPEKAKAEMEKLIKEKTGKGYVEVGGKGVKAEKPAAGKKTSVANIGAGLSKAEKRAKAEKVLAMFANGQWKLARDLLKVAQNEHWLFEELLEGCGIKYGNPEPSMFIKKIFEEDYYDLTSLEYPEWADKVDYDDYLPIKSELAMLEVLNHLPESLKDLKNLQKKLPIHPKMLSKYWKEVVDDTFKGVEYDPLNFSDHWLAERDAEITRIEKECEERGKALKKPWKHEEDLGDGIRLEMMLIPAGSFMMGSPKSEEGRDSNETQHKVTISKPFYLGKFTVTQEQWKLVMGNNPNETEDVKLPVREVSWDDCQEFIEKLNSMNNGGYRLPTEAEWEYACRAGTKTAYFFGNEITPSDANYRYSKIGGVQEMWISNGVYKPNAFGLHNMHGHVKEWCEDWYGDYPRKDTKDPKGPSKGEYRVMRGGDNFDLIDNLRSAFRWPEYPSESSGCGLRLARNI